MICGDDCHNHFRKGLKREDLVAPDAIKKIWKRDRMITSIETSCICLKAANREAVIVD